jgi:hypothetical protein
MTYVAGLVGFVLTTIIPGDGTNHSLPRRLPRTSVFAWFCAPCGLSGRGLSRRFHPKGRELPQLFAQLSLIILLGAWASGLVIGFAAVQWSVDRI